MLKHVVMWRFQNEAEGNTKDTNMTILKGLLEALPAEIPQIQLMQVGRDIVHNTSSFDMGLVSEFADQEALDQYVVHPAHQKVSQFASKVIAERATLDFLF